MKQLVIFLTLIYMSAVFACAPQDLVLASDDPVTGQEFKLEVRAYIPSIKSEKQVIILPPIGGVTTLEAKYASRICARGTSAYVFFHWSKDMEESVEDLAVHNRGTLRGLHAVEIFLEKNPIKTRVLGTSLGGIYAGIAAGKFDLIEKAAIIASGTNLSQIMATSTLPELIELKKKRFEYHGIGDNQEYADSIKKELTVEAETYKNNFKGKELLFIRTNSDSVIAPQYQDELIELFDKKNTQIIITKYGHKKGIIMAFVRRAKRIANFLAY